MKKYLVAIMVLLLTPLFTAQSLKSSFQRNLDFSTGGYFQSWKTENDQKVSQFTVPVSFVVPFDRQLTFSVGTNSAFSSSSSGGETTKLNGLTDTRIMASYVTMDDQLLITGGVTAPTGKTKLEGEEETVAGNIGLYPFAFRVPSYGQGLCANIAGSCAFELNNYILGAGIGFVYKGGFVPYKSSDQKYIPGSEISFNLGGETTTEFGATDAKITLDVAYTLYGKDKYADKEIFKSGNKIIADLRLLLTNGRTNYMIYVKERTKGKNDIGYGTLQTEEKNSNGNQIDAGVVGLFPLQESLTLKAFVEGKMYSKNESELNGATIVGVGVGLNFKLSQSLSLDGLAKISKGNLENKVTTAITGTDIGVGLKYRIF